jgi:hypothetical protein
MRHELNVIPKDGINADAEAHRVDNAVKGDTETEIVLEDSPIMLISLFLEPHFSGLDGSDLTAAQHWELTCEQFRLA